MHGLFISFNILLPELLFLHGAEMCELAYFTVKCGQAALRCQKKLGGTMPMSRGLEAFKAGRGSTERKCIGSFAGQHSA